MADLIFLWSQVPNLLFGLPAQRPGGLLLSLLLLAASFPAGMLLAVPAAVIRRRGETSRGLLALIAARVVESITTVIRALPLVLLLLLVALLSSGRLAGLGPREIPAAWIALTLFTAAYQIEILLGGLRAVPRDVIEAAQAAGLRPLAVLFEVRLPIAGRAALPALTGQAISLFKDTSVVLILGIPELFTTANHILNSGWEQYFVGMYLALGALYFVPAWAIGRFAGWLERRPRLAGSVSSAPALG